MMRTRTALPAMLVLCLAACDGCETERGLRGAPDSGTNPDGGVLRDSGEPTEPEWELVNAPDNPFPCLNPVPAADWGGGFMRCDNGLIFRPAPATCPASMDDMPDECFSDADCDAGYCSCGEAEVFTNNYCSGRGDGQCRSDRDCPTGFHCGGGFSGSSDATFFYLRCQKPADQCVTDDDCIDDGEDAGISSGTGPACQTGAERRFCCLPAEGCEVF